MIKEKKKTAFVWINSKEIIFQQNVLCKKNNNKFSQEHLWNDVHNLKDMFLIYKYVPLKNSKHSIFIVYWRC